MKSLIKDQLLGFLLRKGIINRNQHGFISNHSTCTNLLECTQDWLATRNSSCTTDIIYIDFSRAFDSIVYNKLFNKLESYGINGKPLHWISSFVKNRYQWLLKTVFHLLPKLSALCHRAQYWAQFFL